MSSLEQALSSVRHRPTRALLTALGTGLGIATIVALLAVSGGARQSAKALVDLGPADFGLFQKDAADPTTSVLPLHLAAELDRLPTVAATAPMQLLVGDVAASPGAIVYGVQPGGFLAGRMVITSGRMFSGPDEIVVGDALAGQIHVHVGSQMKVGRRVMRVVGIDHVGIALQDSGAFVSLAGAQSLAQDPGEATTIVVEARSTVKRSLAERQVTRRYANLEVISDSQEATRAGANGELIGKVTFVIAVLAMIIGGIGVMNTMLMAVLERRSEFALLSAVGWSGPRIARLVLWEGVVVSLLGAMIGLLIGTLGANLLVKALGASAFVSPDITVWDLGRGLLIGLLIGVLGGLYPAWRAAHLSPARILAQR
jgi:putative ABC transport system permease protein